MRSITTFVLATAGLLCAGTAAAQVRGNPAPSGGANRSNSQFTLRRDVVGSQDGQTARARMRGGDCAGALPFFDAALRTGGVDPSLRRDRALCHEKLGNPFPAIEDYRAYITELPNAPDAEYIRQRLVALEEQNGQTGSHPAGTKTESYADDSAEVTNNVAKDKGSAKASFSASAGGGRSRKSNLIGPKAGEKEESYDYYVEQEKLADVSESSPLRYGKGLVLGPVLHIPRFFVGDGASKDLAYGFALALRYSLGSVGTLISEIGYAGIGDNGANTAQAGPLLMIGVEARIPLSKWASDHLLLRGGVGYERYVVSGTRAVLHTIPGRFAFGYRHVFGPALGLEILADGGPAFIATDGGDTRVNGVIGASFGFVVGF